MKALLGIAAVVLCGAILLADHTVNAQESNDICRYFPNNTQIRDPDSCNRHITCIEFVSHIYECTGSTPFWDKDNNKCVQSLDDESTCSVSCENLSGTFITDPKSCKGYFFCQDEESALPGTCPGTAHFNETLQACVNKNESECRADTLDICSIVKSSVNIKDEANCHQYFVCSSKGVLSTKTCTNKYYDALLGSCVDKSSVDCPEHPLPKSVCGTDKKPLKNEFVDDDATCRGYFFCADKPNGPDETPTWGQCGANTFFDASKQACVDPLEVKCEWDRCDGRSLTFVSAATKGCREYLRCADGLKQGSELSCGTLFFDEKMGACVNTQVLYTSCKG